jgi:hypothetical protein
MGQAVKVAWRGHLSLDDRELHLELVESTTRGVDIHPIKRRQRRSIHIRITADDGVAPPNFDRLLCVELGLSWLGPPTAKGAFNRTGAVIRKRTDRRQIVAHIRTTAPRLS